VAIVLAFFSSTKGLLLCAVGFLLLASIGSILIYPHNRLNGRHCARLPMCSLGNNPILQVELARNDNDLRQVLTVGDQQANVDDARAGNKLDSWLFIPGYAGLLFVLGLLLARVDPQSCHKLLLLAIMAVPVVAVCDWAENIGIAATLKHIEADGYLHPGDASAISAPSLIKWTLLAAILCLYGVVAIRKLPRWQILIGVVMLAAGLYTVTWLVRYIWERFS
jgi:hypothetical protein